MSLGHMPVEQMLVVTAPDDEVAKLQEQLFQALTREAEAYKKIKHLHEQLTEAQSSSSRSPTGLHIGMDTPDIPWGDTDLSQNSEMSPQSPPPALVVSGALEMTNSRSRSISQPSTPNVKRGLNEQNIRLNHLNLNDEHYQNAQVYPEYPNGGVSNGSTVGVWNLDSGPPRTLSSERLAPLSQKLTDVRREREKPPSSRSHKRSSSMHSITKAVNVSPIPRTKKLEKRQSSPDPILASPPESRLMSPEGEQVKPPGDRVYPVGKKPVSVTASLGSPREPSKPERKKSQRGRSNSTISNWLRRKRENTAAAKSREEPRAETFSIEQIFQVFSQLPASNQQDPLAKYIDRPWTDVCVSGESSREDIQYRNTVWDMFQEETKYLTNLLQPLEQVYKGFLEELHFHGILKIADVDKIFANLSELCELSSSVANDLFQLFSGRSGSRIAPNGELILAFSMFGHKFNPVYQRFCVNFEKQRGFVRALQQLPEFQEYLRVCRTHEIVQKKDLSDLLIAPMQHQCHYQLLLEKVLKYTKDPSEKAVLSSAIKAFVVSLKELEGNIDDSKRSAELLELQETLSWPTVSQLDTDAYIPEEIQSCLSTQQSSELLATKDRQLVYKGTLKLLDSKAKPAQELHVFLFTDLLLFTELKSCKKESNQLIRYQVYGHPLFLESVDVHDIPYNITHKNVITLIEKTVLQQKVKAYSLQAASKDEKAKWVTQILHTQDLLWHRQNDHYIESDV